MRVIFFQHQIIVIVVRIQKFSQNNFFLHLSWERFLQKLFICSKISEKYEKEVLCQKMKLFMCIHNLTLCKSHKKFLHSDNSWIIHTDVHFWKRKYFVRFVKLQAQTRQNHSLIQFKDNQKYTFKSIRIESNCCIDGSFHKKRMVQSITVFVKKVELNIEVLHLVTIFDDSSYNVGVIAV